MVADIDITYLYVVDQLHLLYERFWSHPPSTTFKPRLPKISSYAHQVFRDFSPDHNILMKIDLIIFEIFYFKFLILTKIFKF